MSRRKKQSVHRGRSSRTCRRLPPPRTWSELLANYDAEHATHEREQVHWFATQPSISTVIRLAAEATNHHGKRYDHQYRIRRVAIAAANELLLSHEAEIKSASTFSVLLEMIERLLLPIPGLGELYCYDCAARIGAYLGIKPDRVYLHSGTRVGARALKLSHTRPWLLMSELPEPLQSRSAAEAENILCIYASDFSSLKLS
jgi:hypothetical protein